MTLTINQELHHQIRTCGPNNIPINAKRNANEMQTKEIIHEASTPSHNRMSYPSPFPTCTVLDDRCVAGILMVVLQSMGFATKMRARGCSWLQGPGGGGIFPECLCSGCSMGISLTRYCFASYDVLGMREVSNTVAGS